MSNEYLTHFQGDETFARQIHDLFERVHTRYTLEHTPFLNPHEADVAKRIVGNKHGVLISFDGGIQNAEMCRAILYDEYYVPQPEDYEVAVMELHFPSKFVTITHRDVLGALMNLGLKREMYGDIIVEDGVVYFACEEDKADYLVANLQKVGRANVQVTRSHKSIERHQEFDVKTLSVPSLRLDVILGDAYHLSRSQAALQINSNLVKVNYKEVAQTNFLCHNGDIISLRHHGRFKIVDLQQENRKGKKIIELQFYK